MFRLTQILAAVLVLLAVALGGYAWWLGGRAATRPPGPAAGAAPVVAAPTFAVVVTRREVRAGEILGADALRVVQLPIDPPGALRDVAAATGRVPATDLAAGALLLDSGLAAGLAARLAEGERAVAIRADEVLGVAHRVQPGDFVDVFFLLKVDGREVAQSQARLLLSRQRVLAYGGASVDGPAGPGHDAPAAAGTTPTRTLEAARTVVLAVQVQDVARLALGEANGRLLLALRHPGDTALPDTALFPPPVAALRAGGPGVRTALRPIDQAKAGVAMVDLAGGAPLPAAATPMVAFAPAIASSALVVAPPPGVPTSRRSAPVRGGIEIESIRGDRREIVSY
jgi:pilus assembly protein CpaB